MPKTAIIQRRCCWFVITTNFGGSASPSSDVIGPEIKAFINNTTSYISGEYDNQIQLLLKLEDESGINISSLSFGQDIEAILNDSMPFTLNDLYRSEINNYRKGNITLSLDNLASGLNMMRIKAWDNVGNSNSTAFEFQVKKNSNYITKINNYPNPFINSASFLVEHLLEGENVELIIEILDRKGSKVASLYQEYLRANTVLTLP